MPLIKFSTSVLWHLVIHNIKSYNFTSVKETEGEREKGSENTLLDNFHKYRE